MAGLLPESFCRIFSVGVLSCILLCRNSASSPTRLQTNQNSLFADIMSCTGQLMMQTPLDIKEGNSVLISKVSPNYSYQTEVLHLMEPYLVYLLSLKHSPSSKQIFLNSFSNYCAKHTGVQVFVTCMKKSDSMSSARLRRKQRTPADSINIIDNLYHRYCDESGVREDVLEALYKGSLSEEIQSLVDAVEESNVNGSVVCSQVLEGTAQTATQLISAESLRVETFFNVIKRGVESFTRCLMVTLSPNRKSLLLREHLEMVLLELIGSNMADVTRFEMSVAKQTVSLAGYSNIYIQERRLPDCSDVGLRTLLENKHLMLTGTLKYERTGGSMLTYLASVYAEFRIYEKDTQIGQVTYSSGTSSNIKDKLEVVWWEEEDERRARVSDYNQGISIEKVEGTVELLDLRSGTYISISKSKEMLTLVVRISTTLLYQSSGLLLEPCHYNDQTSEYAGVLQTSTECRATCSKRKLSHVSSMCQRDCFLSGNVQLLSNVYTHLEEMYSIAELKDNILDGLSSAIMTDPSDITTMADYELSVPRDGPVTLSTEADSYRYTNTHKVVQYNGSKKAMPRVTDTVIKLTQDKPENETSSEEGKTTPGRELPKQLLLPPALHSGVSVIIKEYTRLMLCVCTLFYLF